MTEAERKLIDAATRQAKKDIDAILGTLDAIQSNHRRFLKQMRRLRWTNKSRLSK
jgi:hypothetical protein